MSEHKKLKIFITGGAGFLGYHVANYFAERGCEITCCDIDDYVPSDYPKEAKLLKGDVRDIKSLKELMKGFDVVVHGAAALPLWSKKDILDINVQGTKNVLQTALENKIKRVVFISSTAVYGVPKVHPLYEDFKVYGVGHYGESKIQAEAVCKEYREKGLCVPVIRPKTFIGTGRLGVFQILYDWVESGKKIPVIGNGKNRYQLLEVEDLCSAIWLVSSKEEKVVNDTFNVGAQKFNTVEEDVGELCKFAGNGAKVMKTPAGVIKAGLMLFEAVKLSPLYKWVYGTADKDSFVSTEKIEKQLGWKAEYSNADALIRSYKWYLEHKGDIKQGTGVTHRIAWKQGILGLFKKFM